MNVITPILSIYLALVTPGGYVDGFSGNVLETEITSGVMLFDYFGIVNDIYVLSDTPDDGYFSPYQVDFKIRAFFTFKGIEIGYKHECYHPILPYDSTRAYTGGNDRVYLKYEAEFK